MNRQPENKQHRIFRALSDAGLLLVQPGFLVECRTLHGLHDDRLDVALSLKWHDAEGCEWEADFTEKSLMEASVTRNQIALKDLEGDDVCVELYELTPKRITSTTSRSIARNAARSTGT